jgi:hypothetical protein
MKYAMISGALALAAFTGCAVDDGTTGNADLSSTEQATTTTFLSCTVTANQPDYYTGVASINCPAHTTYSLQICLQQLVTGGWQNVGGIACTNDGPFTNGNSSGGVGGTGGSVSYFTSGRWYRTQAYVVVSRTGQGGDDYVYSSTCQGNGADRCF